MLAPLVEGRKAVVSVTQWPISLVHHPLCSSRRNWLFFGLKVFSGNEQLLEGSIIAFLCFCLAQCFKVVLKEEAVKQERDEGNQFQ